MSKLSQRLAVLNTLLGRKAPPPRTIPFGEWKPDLPAYANPGAISAKNVIPQEQSYAPVKNLSATSTALTARCYGAIAARDKSNVVWGYAGDATKLYELSNNAWADQSLAGGYTATLADGWEFAIWDTGQKIIATNGVDDVQSIGIGLGTSANFADMITAGTAKPVAKHVDIVRDFVVLGNYTDTSGSGTHYPNGIIWSTIRDETLFDQNAATQADSEKLPEGGWVNRVIGGAEYGVIFQDTLIRRMEYVGSPLIFEFPAVDRRRGTPLGKAVVAFGRLIFFISEEGFFRFDGVQSTPIGSGKVDRTFWGQFDIANKASVSAAIDPLNKLVAWAFPGSGSTGGLNNKIYLHKWDTGWFTEAEVDTEILLKSLTQGYTLEGLDAIAGGGSGPGGGASGTGLEFATLASLDAEEWKGGAQRFAGFDQSHKMGFFDGSTLAATLDTGEMEMSAGGRAMVRSLRPLVDGGTPTMQVSSRQRLQDTVTFDSAATVNTVGECSVRNSGRYQRYRLNMPAASTWTHAQGVQVRFAPQGNK